MDRVERRAIQRLLQVEVSQAWRCVGFTTARTWSIELVDGRRVFAKFAVDDETTAGNLTEAVVLDNIASPHLPELIAIADNGSLLVTEDLTASDWAPHLGELGGLWAAIGEIGAHPGPPLLSASFRVRGETRGLMSSPTSGSQSRLASTKLGLSATHGHWPSRRKVQTRAATGSCTVT